MRTRWIQAAFGLLAALSWLWPIGVQGQTPVNETRTAPALGVVVIENMLGSVTVRGWDKNEVHVTGTLSGRAKRLEIESDEERTHIEVVWPSHNFSVGLPGGAKGESDLEVLVPVGSEVRVEGVNLEIAAGGVAGKLALESVNGSITVTGKPEVVEASAVNGTITLRTTSPRIYAETVNGTIELTGPQGEVQASSVSGSIRIQDAVLDELECSTVSGNIEVTGELERRASLSVESHSGDIVLTFPKAVDAQFDVSTFSGNIETDFGGEPERASEYAPGWELEVTVGSGSAKVDVSTFSGRVKLRAR